MLSVDEALQLVLARAAPAPATRVALERALGLVLAEDVTADIDSPPCDKSLVDGYAVVAADLAGGRARFEILEEITAGALPSQVVKSGTATRIMTGAPIPTGADAVVMVEQSRLLPAEAGLGCVELEVMRISAGQNIMRRAVSMARGQKVLSAGCVLRPPEIGILAEVGHTQVQVVVPPSVAVLSTGNELVSADEKPGAGQIRNSNAPMLLAAASTTGSTRSLDLGIARDDRAGLRKAVARGLECDVLLISGGVSAGVLDLVPSVLEELGVEQVFHKLNLKPGKPLWFGVKRGERAGTLVFGLPGNPVSSLVCFELFVRPAIASLAGKTNVAPVLCDARLTKDHLQRGDRVAYHPARLSEVEGQLLAEPLSWKGSGDLRTLAEANGLAQFPAGEQQYRAGTAIRALRLWR